MPNRLAGRGPFARCVLVPLLACALIGIRSAAAQDHTTDIPRLSIGFSGGRHGGQILWDIGNQPISTGKLGNDGKPTPPSVFDLHREVDPGVTFSGHVNVYFNEHIGFTGELTYLGLGLKDKCTLTTDGGDADLRAACKAVGAPAAGGLNVDQATSSSTFLTQAGLVIHPFKPAVLEPYIKGLIGVANSPRNTGAISTIFVDSQGASDELPIYPDLGWSTVSLTGTAAAGITSAPISGIQFHAELRESWISQSIVTGPSSGQGVVPPKESTMTGFMSFLVGIDIVLKKDHSKRY